MKKTLLFSDVHLKTGAAHRPHRDAFTAFLRSFDPSDYDRFICLGDLFDFWFEYRHAIFSGCFEVLRAFAELRDAGVELHLVCGNHDFWAGRFLRDELGFQIYQDSAKLPFGEKTALFTHGDGVNPKDWGYRFYKRIARNPLVVRAFGLLHPDWAMALAQGVSHGSRTLTRVEDTANGPEAAAIRAYAKTLLAQGEADIVGCGHAHAPVIEEYPAPGGTGFYLNPGDWMSTRSYIIWDAGAFRLHYHGNTSASAG